MRNAKLNEHTLYDITSISLNAVLDPRITVLRVTRRSLNAALFVLAVSAFSGAYPRLLVDRVPGQGTAAARTSSGRAVNYRPALPEVPRYLARESAKFIARSREWYVIMPLYFTYLPSSDRDKITGQTPFMPSVFPYHSVIRRLPSLRIFSLARAIFMSSFSDSRKAFDIKKCYSFEKIKDCGRIIGERSLPADAISDLRVSNSF